MKAFYDSNTGLTEIARVSTFGATNRRDIIRRVMNSGAFGAVSFAQAVEAFRSYERAGLVASGEGFVVIYHDAA